MIKKTPLLFLSGVFLLLDQWLKYQALHTWQLPRLTLGGWFGWEPFMNPGVAFGIPVPMILVLTGTIPIIILLAFSLTREIEEHHTVTWLYLERLEGMSLIIAGALSNFIDRVRFHATIDYLRVLTAVINVADILIVAGFVVYFVSIKQKSNKTKKQSEL